MIFQIAQGEKKKRKEKEGGIYRQFSLKEGKAEEKEERPGN